METIHLSALVVFVFVCRVPDSEKGSCNIVVWISIMESILASFTPPSKHSERPHFSWFSVGAKSSDEVHWIHQERPTDRGTALLATHPSVPLLLTLTRHTCCAYIFDMGGLIRRQGMSKKSMQNTREKFRPSFSCMDGMRSERAFEFVHWLFWYIELMRSCFTARLKDRVPFTLYGGNIWILEHYFSEIWWELRAHTWLALAARFLWEQRSAPTTTHVVRVVVVA